MKSPHIWIILALLAIIVAGIIFWPKDRSPEIEQLQQNITREYTIKRDLQASNAKLRAKIDSDSLRQAQERVDFEQGADSLGSVIAQLKRKSRVVYIRETEPAIDSLITNQDSLLLVQRARIDTLTVNLSDLRVDLQSVTDNFEAQLAASDRIIENQGQILNEQAKEIKRERRGKRLAIIGGIVATVAALLVR